MHHNDIVFVHIDTTTEGNADLLMKQLHVLVVELFGGVRCRARRRDGQGFAGVLARHERAPRVLGLLHECLVQVSSVASPVRCDLEVHDVAQSWTLQHPRLQAQHLHTAHVQLQRPAHV